MPMRELPALKKFSPWRIALLVLVSAFLVETVLMFLLPLVLPRNASLFSSATWDACLLAIILAPLLWMLVVRPLRALADSRQQLLVLTLSSQEDERGRIARDLHDGIGQALTCLLVGLRTIEESSTLGQAKAQAKELRRLGGQTHDEIRRLARGLRPMVLDDAGLVPALERFLQDLRSIHDVDATLEYSGEACSRLPRDVETSLYRITQEAVNNAIRHGTAATIRVTLVRGNDSVTLIVSEDGCGFDAEAQQEARDYDQSFGLSSIRERAWLVGGQAILQSTRGAGSRWTINIPLSHGNSANVEDTRSDS